MQAREKKDKKKAKKVEQEIQRMTHEIEGLKKKARTVGGVARTEAGGVDYSEDFFGKAAYLTVSGQLEVSCLAQGAPPGVDQLQLAEGARGSPCSPGCMWQPCKPPGETYRSDRIRLGTAAPRPPSPLPGSSSVLALDPCRGRPTLALSPRCTPSGRRSARRTQTRRGTLRSSG